MIAIDHSWAWVYIQLGVHLLICKQGVVISFLITRGVQVWTPDGTTCVRVPRGILTAFDTSVYVVAHWLERRGL